jgi:cytoskeleton protein RodZ
VQLTVTQPLTKPLDTTIAVPGATATITPAAPSETPAATGGGVQSSGVAAAPPPQGEVYGAQNKNARVVLHVRQATRILVEGPDGRIYINHMLKPGDSYQLPNIVGLTLTTSNAGGVEVELDGATMGVLGRSQEPAEALSLDPQSIIDRNNGNHYR